MDDSQKQITENLKNKTMKMKKNSKISLEQYLDFLSSNKQLLLTAGHLNQIIRMHGYFMIKDKKRVLMDAVSTIDLINLSRSTLEENISSAVPSIPLEDVIWDLKDLDWQECCVTSLLTSSSWKQNDSDPSPDHQDPTGSSKKLGRKLRPLIECLGGVSAINGVSSSSASKNPGSLLRPQSKRKKTAA